MRSLLATLLEAGRLEGIRIPSEKEEQQRLLTRTREQLVGERTAIKNRIRMKCHQLGLLEPEDRRAMSHKLVKEILARSPGREFTLVIQAHWQVWKSLDQEIKKIEKELEAQAIEDAKEEIYRSVPGVGALSSRILSL